MKSNLKDTGLLIFRVGVCYFMIAFHGLVKLQYLFSGEEIKFYDPLGIGMILSFFLSLFAEFICAIFVGMGLFARWAAAILVINMATIFFIHHAADAMVSKQLPGLFLLAFVLVLLLGPGRFSLDKILRNRS